MIDLRHESNPAPAPAPAWTPGDRLVLAGALLGAALHLDRFRLPEFALDDAWISFRIARNLVEHGVLTFNVGQPPVEGMTNLLWTCLVAVYVALVPDTDPLNYARLLGGACHLAGVAVAGICARRLAAQEGLSPGAGTLAMGLAAGLMALSGSMAYHALSGLETGLWVLLILGTMERAIAGRGLAVGALMALGFATRPEMGLYGPLILGAMATSLASPREAARALALLVTGALLVEAFRWVTYGSLIPNTFYAKPPSSGGAWEYGMSWLSLAGGGGLALLALAGARGSRRLIALSMVSLTMFLAVLATGGDWMPGLRRLGEANALLYIVASVGVVRCSGPWRAATAIGLLAMATSSVVGALGNHEARRFPHEILARVGTLASQTPGVNSIAGADIGRLGWTFPGDIYDLAGLVDSHIARRKGGHGEKEWDEQYFREWSPELVLVFSMAPIPTGPGQQLMLRAPDAEVVTSIREHGGYLPWRSAPTIPNEWLVVFVRDDIELSEKQWGARETNLDYAFPTPRTRSGSSARPETR